MSVLTTSHSTWRDACLHWAGNTKARSRYRSLMMVRARVISDGEAHELAPLLALPQVKRVNFGSALANLLAMSRAGLLITSGSTFSMWASFLHQVPTIWHPGELLQSVHIGAQKHEVEWSAGERLPDWVAEGRA